MNMTDRDGWTDMLGSADQVRPKPLEDWTVLSRNLGGAENAGPENAGPENAGPNCRG